MANHAKQINTQDVGTSHSFGTLRVFGESRVTTYQVKIEN